MCLYMVLSTKTKTKTRYTKWLLIDCSCYSAQVMFACLYGNKTCVQSRKCSLCHPFLSSFICLCFPVFRIVYMRHQARLLRRWRPAVMPHNLHVRTGISTRSLSCCTDDYIINDPIHGNPLTIDRKNPPIKL